MFWDMGNSTAQNLIKPVVYGVLWGYLAETEQKGLEKHCVYKVPVMAFAGAENPYKTLVKSTFQKCNIGTHKSL